jgi:hypothetical protein
MSPVTWVLSLWGVWDVLVVFALTLSVTVYSIFKKSSTGFPSSINSRLVLGTVIGLEADILVRIFIFIPGQFWWFFYGILVEELQLMWLVAGFITPIKVALAAVATMTIGKSMLKYLQEQKIDAWDNLSSKEESATEEGIKV